MFPWKIFITKCAFCCVQTLVIDLIFNQVSQIFFTCFGYSYHYVFNCCDCLASWKTCWGLDTLQIYSFLLSLSQFSIWSTFCFCIVFAWHLHLLFSQLFFEWHDLCTLKIHFVVSSVSLFHVSVQVPLATVRFYSQIIIFSPCKTFVTWFISHRLLCWFFLFLPTIIALVLFLTFRFVAGHYMPSSGIHSCLSTVCISWCCEVSFFSSS